MKMVNYWRTMQDVECRTEDGLGGGMRSSEDYEDENGRNKEWAHTLTPHITSLSGQEEERR